MSSHNLLSNPDEIRIIEYSSMHCVNCGNFALLQCEPEDPRTNPPCDLWVPLDYFEYRNAYPKFEVTNIPDIKCVYCEGTGIEPKTGIRCPDCKGKKTVKAWGE